MSTHAALTNIFFLSFQIEDAMLMFDKQTMRHRGKIVVKTIRRALWEIRIIPQFSSILTIQISSTLFPTFHNVENLFSLFYRTVLIG